jgi:hypothetical protein
VNNGRLLKKPLCGAGNSLGKTIDEKMNSHIMSVPNLNNFLKDMVSTLGVMTALRISYIYTPKIIKMLGT